LKHKPPLFKNFKLQIPDNIFTFTPFKDDIKIEFLPIDKLNLTTSTAIYLRKLKIFISFLTKT